VTAEFSIKLADLAVAQPIRHSEAGRQGAQRKYHARKASLIVYQYYVIFMITLWLLREVFN